MKNEFVVDGRYYFPTMEEACEFADEILAKTGVFVSVEAV